MKKIKFLVMFLVLVMIMSIGTTVMASRSLRKFVSNVNVTITEPVNGQGPSGDITFTGEGIEKVTISWIDVAAGEFMPATRKYNGGSEYEARIFATLKEGYQWADSVTFNVNGKDMAGIKASTQMKVTPKYVAIKLIDKIEAVTRILTPKLGVTATKSIVVKTEGLDMVSYYFPGDQMSDGKRITTVNDTRVYMDLKEGYELAENVTGTIDRNEAKVQRGGARRVFMIYEPVQEKVIDTVDISFKEPELDEFVSFEANSETEGVKVITLTWIDVIGGVFMKENQKYKAGRDYTAIVFVTPKEGYKFADKVTLKINGKNIDGTKAGYEMKTELKYTIKKEVEYPWTKISSWAEKELIEANEKELIPTCLEDKDYTKNITRAEFAAAAVKLYEELTGTKAVPIANNPFTDTKDIEILKAFNIGITTGISETEFDPKSEITREQMATMMTRALTKAGINTKRPANSEKFADDSEISTWASDSVYYMSSIEIIKGVGENKFNSKGTATREQALAVSIRSFNKLNK